MSPCLSLTFKVWLLITFQCHSWHSHLSMLWLVFFKLNLLTSYMLLSLIHFTVIRFCTLFTFLSSSAVLSRLSRFVDSSPIISRFAPLVNTFFYFFSPFFLPLPSASSFYHILLFSFFSTTIYTSSSPFFQYHFSNGKENIFYFFNKIKSLLLLPRF